MKLPNFLGRASLVLKKLKKCRDKIPNKSILITQRFPSTDKFQEINRRVNNFVLPSNSLRDRERANRQRLGKQDWKLQYPITPVSYHGQKHNTAKELKPKQIFQIQIRRTSFRKKSAHSQKHNKHRNPEMLKHIYKASASEALKIIKETPESS